MSGILYAATIVIVVEDLEIEAVIVSKQPVEKTLQNRLEPSVLLES